MPGSERYSHQLLYATVRQRILTDIEQGVYQANQQIPTESELCELYDVSRITIRKAITDLVKDGVLIRWQGKGTFVQSKKIENELLTVSGFTDFGVSQGKKTREEIIKQELIPADDFCSRLDIANDSQMFKLVRVMYLELEPLFIDYSYIPLARYQDFDSYYQPGNSTYQLLQERYDTQIVSDKKLIDIYTATKAEAKWLKCELGEPLFRISKIAYDQQKRPVHCSELFCRANRISLTIDNHHKG
ncbi:GntR family transcriptional regulator [Serratia fonticola]|jgi:GntR family frlABCD operon transcriptional regulator|uniref:HTH-type transcriptional regulator frlR n=2 Tax=Serratia fonticola TaxID=47917 RepID=A0A0F7D348_SERFO|nr:GntR family transcriptional regulator [Serratia fonticola]AKG71860.1 transcriptional regulator [Serratia fonticola]NTY89515.1 transcriptional regulator PhoB [Serratia fonticola]NTZ15243.1 transcriptional regulator PhoB [Serratia fonticola]CAI1223221.1 HTH-type transcriptional regulator frlR [Serratia fonticola]CAI1227319.1 HTH-type transcriptional regulator frlR [Serratia fonticola]